MNIEYPRPVIFTNLFEVAKFAKKGHTKISGFTVLLETIRISLTSLHRRKLEPLVLPLNLMKLHDRSSVFVQIIRDGQTEDSQTIRYLLPCVAEPTCGKQEAKVSLG